MRGAIELFTAIGLYVQVIATFAGGKPDTGDHLNARDGEWTAFLR